MCDSDDDTPQLSAETFAALQAFYSEKAEEEGKLEAALNTGSIGDVEIKEDWVSVG